MTATDSLIGQAEWMGRLLAAFGGDVKGWEWTGDVAEDPNCQGTCACGHKGLRYLFTWKKDGVSNPVITGSVCVNNVPGISPEQLARIQAEIARRDQVEREAAAKARNAAKAEKVKLVAEEIRQLLKPWRECAEDKAAGRWLNLESYNLARTYHDWSAALRHGLRLKSVAGQLRSLTATRDALRKRLNLPPVESVPAAPVVAPAA